jgi:carbamoyltransferase
VLGLNFTYHELSACLLKNGQLVAAVEEERFTRIKRGKPALVDNPDVLPLHAIEYCLGLMNIHLSEVDHITFSFFPPERLKNINSDPYFEEGNWGSKSGEELFNKKILAVPEKLSAVAGVDLTPKIQWVPHHICHASSSFYVSPFKEAAILSIDGIGEIASTWLGHGTNHTIKSTGEVTYPNSVGFVWEKMSQFLGFSEYDSAKVMGLSAYGNPDRFYPVFQQLIDVSRRGTFVVDHDVFRFRVPDFTALEEKFGVKKIPTPAARTSDHEDIAAALQKITNDVVLHLAKYLSEETGSRHLCLAGGVALNCVANAEVMKSGLFDKIYVQPAANDAGTALGGACYLWHQVLGNERGFIMDHAYWGPGFSDNEIEEALKKAQVLYEKQENVEQATAKHLAEGAIIGWFQGRCEWGPRALGNRSLLADPRKIKMKEILNERIKKRELFRPFAPSVLAEDVEEWFATPQNCTSLSTEFMEINFEARETKRNLIPAVVHVDGTSRAQVVSKKTNQKYHKLITEFKKITGVPLLLNTSFNDNEPIVCTPQDAVNTFLRTKMDYLAIGDFLVRKN